MSPIDKKYRRRIEAAQLLAYLLIVVICIFGFHEVDVQNQQRCEASEDYRTALRNTINGVVTFALELAEPPPGSDPKHLTQEQKQDIALYKNRVKEFQRKTLEMVPDRQPACSSYLN